jgi:hypothetical protein
VPAETPYLIEVDALRKLAHSIPGDHPVRINYQQVAVGSLPRAGVFAGASFDPHPMTHGSYQLVYPDRFAMIDATMGRALFDANFAGDGGNTTTLDGPSWRRRSRMPRSF